MAEKGVMAEETTLSKTAAKRKYLLVDEDLEDLQYELKDNPLNKKYPPMKIFKSSEVEQVAMEKWGSLEKIEEEIQKQTDRHSKIAEKKEAEMQKLLDCDEIYEPMKSFMNKIKLPKVNDADLDESNEDKELVDYDIIVCYCDCMHSRPPGVFGKSVYKAFPSASNVDKSTPFNDRRKLGHYSWSRDKHSLIINLYVSQKWSFKSKTCKSPSGLVYGALALGLQRLSTALTDEWKKHSTDEFKHSIATYISYKENEEQFKKIVEENFHLPLKIFTTEDIKTSKQD